jgi:hypothetical protein
MATKTLKPIPVERREVMYGHDDDPLEVAIGGDAVAWVERVDGDDPFDVLKLVVNDLRYLGYLDKDQGVALSAKPILMRVESDVEAKINGRADENCYIECTTRARHPYPFWRVERAA